MGVPPPDAPDLVGVITAANDVGLPYVVIGGFAVIANQYVRGTEDVAAIKLSYHGQPARVASLASLVAFKRIAGRPRDEHDLTELERIHGELPIEPIPGLDDRS